MAVAFDAKATVDAHTTGTGVTTLSNANHTVGASLTKGALLLVASFDGIAPPTALSAKWDTAGTNQTITQIGSTISTGATESVAIFGLLAPTAGNKNCTLTWTGTLSCAFSLISFSGVEQSSIANAFKNFNSATGTASPASVVITSASGDYTVAVFVASASADLVTLSQTNLFGVETGDPNFSSAASYAAGAATVTHQCTLSATGQWAVAGVDIVAATGGAAFIARRGISNLQAVKRASYW